VRGAAIRARPSRGGVLERDDPLDLAQLGIGVLQLRCSIDDYVDPDRVAYGHLVDESAEIQLQLGDASRQLIAPPLEIEPGLVHAQRGACR